PARPDPYASPQVQRFMQRRMASLGMTGQQFTDHYFAGFSRRPTVAASGNLLSIESELHAPRDMIARARDGREVRIPAGTRLGSMAHMIYSDHVDNAGYFMDLRYQGLGIAKTIFKNQIDVYRRMG